MKKTILFVLVAGLAGFAQADGSPPWAKCLCEEPSPLPAGTSWADGELSFTNCAANGGASFDFAALDAAEFDGATIRFVDGTIPVDSLAFDPTRGLTFVGGSGTILKGVADKPVFDGLNPQPATLNPQLTTWSNLTFTCDAAVSPVWRNGGAIAVKGGSFTIADCDFTGCFSEEFGGAVYAPLLSDDSTITNCTFEGSWVSAYNGYGGAIYVSASEAGRTLSVSECEFTGNEAVNGGAICTVRAADDDELAIALEVSSCRFEANVADYGGGAIFAEGAVTVKDEGETDFVGNAAGLDGGAICLSGIVGVSDPVEVSVGAGTSFLGNSAANDIDDSRWWTCGGALAVLIPGASLAVSGRHVIFDGNYADSQSSAFGGAIYAASGTVMNVSCAAFLANRAGTFGGAVFSYGDRSVISVCIFSNNTVTSVSGYGGAVSVESGCALSISNSTVRGSNRNAIDAYGSKATLVNCIVVGNDDVDISVIGDGDAELVAEHTSYGLVEVDEGTSVVTNACLSGRDASIFLGASLRLDSESVYLPEACEGLVQEAWDYDGVKYGSRPAGYSMGVYECSTATSIEVVGVTWYHNRSDGLYYPRVDVRYLGGDAERIVGMTLTCGGESHELTAADVARLQSADDGEVLGFGVDPATFVPYSDGPANFGFVPPANRLFGVHEPARPVTVEVTVTATLRVAEVVSVPRKTRAVTAVRQTTTVPVVARFTEFRIGERISGRVESVPNAMVKLLGCAALGGEWKPVCELEIDATGAFSTAVPEGMRFFRLEAEVVR